ncbi:MAG: GreA/GreB family elongation factor [Puniceicoccales bacterium]|jgi:transcription elongation GreA/GreB family factor|nr:GreA/GreB family elongation factor [Puniceicoccales bacterium]
MNKETVDRLLEKAPELRSYRGTLEMIEPGKYCWHRTWGVGCVEAYDEEARRVIIRFEGEAKEHRMDPLFCAQKLQFLEEGNLLVEARKNPEKMESLFKNEPTELVVQVLQSLPRQRANGNELQLILSCTLRPFMDEAAYKKWWNLVSKKLKKEARVVTPKKRTDPYVLRSTPVLPEQVILEEFYLTKQPLRKIELAEDLQSLAQSVDSIREDLPQILEELTKVIQNAKPLTPAQRLQGCWVRNDLARCLHEDVEVLQPTAPSLLRENNDLSRLAEELPSVYQKRFLDSVARTYPNEAEWTHICLQLLRSSTGKFTSECVDFLLEKKQEKVLSEALQKWLSEQHLRVPVLLWIVKNRRSGRYAHLIRPLMSAALLKAIFQAVDLEALSTPPGRRILLSSAVQEDKDLVQDLLSGTDAELARDLAQGLLMNQGFDILTKRSILARFIRVHPELQSMVEAKADSSDEPLWVSAVSLERLKREYDLLVNQKIPENSQAVSMAREKGDLKENAEYQMARQDQDVLLARRQQIEKDLSMARVFHPSETSIHHVGIGTVVELEDEKGKRRTMIVLGAWDSDPQRNIISYKTPMGQSLLGKKVGESFSCPTADGGLQTFTVRSLSTWNEAK